ncbi:hypothetical protein QVD17_17717 [Tagetes erecta]|uniref:Uncharacterized protein n=1 Tax=Tagetes erecta TaxID=13708 RepID=A0AAD8KYU2_TARER|nr:hypothetical protein QVD17_17717 [Tagetes erecta]
MAGLQYNFFPTDFLYPQPAKTIADVSAPQVIVSNNKKPMVSRDELTMKKSSVNAKNQNKTLKLVSSSSFDFAVIDKQT